MPSDCISYQKSGYFSKLMNDYLDEKTNLKALYNRFPKLENFSEQIHEKQNNFTFAKIVAIERHTLNHTTFYPTEYTVSSNGLFKRFSKHQKH